MVVARVPEPRTSPPSDQERTNMAVRAILSEASDKLHALESEGAEFSDTVDLFWSGMTSMIVSLETGQYLTPPQFVDGLTLTVLDMMETDNADT